MKRTPAHSAFAAWCAAIDPAAIDAAWERCNDNTKAAWQRVADALSAPAQTTTDTFPSGAAALQWVEEQGFSRKDTPGPGWRWTSRCGNFVARLLVCEDNTYRWEITACPAPL